MCAPWLCALVKVHSSAGEFYSVWQKQRHSLDVDGEVTLLSPEASITIHYYSALPACKCFLTTRDSQPARFPRSPSAEADKPGWTVNARVGKKAHCRNMLLANLSGLNAYNFKVYIRETLLIRDKIPLDRKSILNNKTTHWHYVTGATSVQ